MCFLSVHVRLEEELISLQMTESRLHTELDAMQRKQVEIEQSLENFDNQEQMREQMDDKRKVKLPLAFFHRKV